MSVRKPRSHDGRTQGSGEERRTVPRECGLRRTQKRERAPSLGERGRNSQAQYGMCMISMSGTFDERWASRASGVSASAAAEEGRGEEEEEEAEAEEAEDAEWEEVDKDGEVKEKREKKERPKLTPREVVMKVLGRESYSELIVVD